MAPLSLAPDPLDFGDQPVGEQSASMRATWTNDNSSGPEIINGVSISGTDSGDFAVASTTCKANTEVPASGTCTVDVVFTPSATGIRNATLNVMYCGECTDSISLKGNGTFRSLHVDPTSLDFGNQAVDGGATASKQVLVTNDGTAPVDFGTAQLSGSNAGDFKITNDQCSGQTFQPQDACTIDLTFDPPAAGGRSATLNINDNAPGAPQKVSLSGTGTAPQVSLNPTALDFAGVPVGTTSAEKTVSVKNTGNAPLSISSASIGGTNAGDFAISSNSCSGATLQPGQTCSIGSTFHPTVAGSRSSTLSINDNASGTPHQVPLTGTGNTPDVGLSPASLAFADQQAGTTSPPQTVTVTNNGSAPLQISSVSIAGPNASDFAIPGGSDLCSGKTLQQTQKCTIAAVFQPAAVGSSAGHITIADNAPGGSQQVGLSGNGVAPPPVGGSGIPTPALTLDLASVSFGNLLVGGEPGTQTITLRNTGTAPVTFGAITITGPDAADFAIVSNVCGTTLAPGGSCALQIRFAPKASRIHSATLVINDDAPGAPHTVTLTGTGLPPPTLFKTVNVEPISGTVLVALPRGSAGSATRAHASQSLKGLHFVPLQEARQVPIGSFFNTKKGKVRIVTAGRKRKTTQTGSFTSGIFQMLQRRSQRGIADARLAGGNFNSCKSSAGKATTARRRLSKKVIRKIRANVKGKFRTSGKVASATVRGTDWGMFDRCDGTLTVVRRGTVVVRDIKAKRNITVRRGKSFLVPAR